MEVFIVDILVNFYVVCLYDCFFFVLLVVGMDMNIVLVLIILKEKVMNYKLLWIGFFFFLGILKDKVEIIELFVENLDFIYVEME